MGSLQHHTATYSTPCPDCEGGGRIGEELCHVCAGTGAQPACLLCGAPIASNTDLCPRCATNVAQTLVRTGAHIAAALVLGKSPKKSHQQAV